jgi:hypothetical protein
MPSRLRFPQACITGLFFNLRHRSLPNQDEMELTMPWPDRSVKAMKTRLNGGWRVHWGWPNR